MPETVAEFMARGGKIKSVQEVARTASERELYNMSMGENAFGRWDRKTGGTLTDNQVLTLAERENCE